MSKHTRIKGTYSATPAARSAAQWQRKVDELTYAIRIYTEQGDSKRLVTAQAKLDALMSEDPNAPAPVKRVWQPFD